MWNYFDVWSPCVILPNLCNIISLTFSLPSCSILPRFSNWNFWHQVEVSRGPNLYILLHFCFFIWLWWVSNPFKCLKLMDLLGNLLSGLQCNEIFKVLLRQDTHFSPEVFFKIPTLSFLFVLKKSYEIIFLLRAKNKARCSKPILACLITSQLSD